MQTNYEVTASDFIFLALAYEGGRRTLSVTDSSSQYGHLSWLISLAGQKCGTKLLAGDLNLRLCSAMIFIQQICINERKAFNHSMYFHGCKLVLAISSRCHFLCPLSIGE